MDISIMPNNPLLISIFKIRLKVMVLTLHRIQLFGQSYMRQDLSKTSSKTPHKMEDLIRKMKMKLRYRL